MWHLLIEHAGDFPGEMWIFTQSGIKTNLPSVQVRFCLLLSLGNQTLKINQPNKILFSSFWNLVLKLDCGPILAFLWIISTLCIVSLFVKKWSLCLSSPLIFCYSKCGPEPTASTLPGSLPEMQSPRPLPRTAESEAAF